MDFPGQWQHTSYPASLLTLDSFKDGYGFDGSSMRGWKSIHESDMLIIPDASTMFVDPFVKEPTISLICDVYEPVTREKYQRCPRNIAQKAEAYLKSTGIGDTAFVGPEAEFFVFDNIRYETNSNSAFFEVDSVEGHWNTGRDEEPNLGYKPRPKEGYFPVAPNDSLIDYRNDVTLKLIDAGIDVEASHHEVASGGQCEIDLKYNSLVKSADELLMFKYFVKNTAKEHNKTATFMPKPIVDDNGSGMHLNMSIWKKNKNVFAGSGYGGLSEEALYFIGGILKHADALLAFTNPTTNSYRRLVPGFEAPVRLAYSQSNRSASIRLPFTNNSKAKRVEFRCPDPSANGYLAYSAVLLAGLDGILNRIDPGEPLDKDIYDLPPEELKNVPETPGSLEAALNALAADHDFLLKGNVFTEDVINAWINYKMENEVKSIAARPHPYEFSLYYNV